MKSSIKSTTNNIVFALSIILFLSSTTLFGAENTQIPSRSSQGDNPPRTAQPAGVVVVLAGGGAKGFAHLAVLRRLEQARIPIARIVGTSMGAVIGGLYAAGVSTEEIENVIGSLDPARVALDQLDRLELPQRTRAQQQLYPIDLEFGVRDGKLRFARGFSDGQRFLELLQRLLANIPSKVDFNQLKIPFRAVATRYRDGETQVFDRGSLYLAIRASMAAPGVFAPVEIEGETYVDGGLVANLPIEVALGESAPVVIASYLGGENSVLADAADTDAVQVANRMLDILIHQNERRNLKKLRSQDILVQPKLQGIGFTDFSRASEIVGLGEQAVKAVEARFAVLDEQYGHLLVKPKLEGFGFTDFAHASEIVDQGKQAVKAVEARFAVLEAQYGHPGAAPSVSTPATPIPSKRIDSIKVSGQSHVPAAYIQQSLDALLGQPYNPLQTEASIDALYTTGYFERVSYALENEPSSDGNERTTLLVDVREKPYGPNIFKTSFGFLLERDGTRQFGLNLGYRRPWLTESGLELQADLQIGTNTDAGLKLYQPLGAGLGLEAYASYSEKQVPFYDQNAAQNKRRPLSFGEIGTQKIGLDLSYQYERIATLSAGLLAGRYQARWKNPDLVVVNPQGEVIVKPMTEIGIPEQLQVNYQGIRLALLMDQLDAPTFPTRGYFVSASSEIGLGGTEYTATRFSAKIAHSLGPHILNLGANYGSNKLKRNCTGFDCATPSDLFLGGFQLMSAYRLGELNGDRLLHLQATYLYQLSTGGLLRQKTYLGFSLEAGNAWTPGEGSRPDLKRSRTLFIAVDSKIGDIYLGLANGSDGAKNLFLQLGKRFSL